MESVEKKEIKIEETKIEGRNAVIEAFRSGKPVDKLFLLDGCQDGPIKQFCGKQKKEIRLLILYPKNVWTRFLIQESIRGPLPTQRRMNILKWRICWHWRRNGEKPHFL